MNSDASSGNSQKLKEKKGFVKSPRRVEHELFGPESPLPEKWRVFLFIKYRIQNNKSESQSERISRDYIIEQTGIWANNYSRIILALIKENLIEVADRNSDCVSTFWLSRSRFSNDVIAKDLKKKPGRPSVKDQPKAETPECGQLVDNIKMMSETESQHQNDVRQHQNDEGKGITRSPFLQSFNSLRARGRGGGDLVKGMGPERDLEMTDEQKQAEIKRQLEMLKKSGYA